MDNNQISLDSLFHALADPTRRAVVQQLGQGSATISELAEPFDMALPSFMKHIRVLEASGLIGSKKVGRVRTCELVPQRLDDVDDWIAVLREAWEHNFKRLDEYLDQLQEEDKV